MAQGDLRMTILGRQGMEAETMTEQQRIFRAIRKEREYQIKKWGGEDHDRQHKRSDWIRFIQEEVREAESAWLDKEARQELVQVAALCVAALEAMGSIEAR